MRRRHPLLLGCALSLAAAAPAAGAEVTIGTNEAARDLPVWSPATVTIQPGDTVRWKLTSSVSPPNLHNVFSTTAGGGDSWSLVAEYPSPEATYTFTTPGRYRFYCTFHSTGLDGMAGEVVVGNPPPPPPPPLSEQPFVNDAPAPAALETGGLDTTKPALRGVAAKRSGTRVKVAFRVSEQSLVTVRFARGGRIVKTRKAAVARKGSLTVRGLKAGRYAVRVGATDIAGNRSRVRTAHVTVR